METIITSPAKEVRIGPEHPFVIIGERINPTGRKKLAAEMEVRNYDRVRADTIAQVEAGAHMLDVNAGIPLADEPAILAECIELVQSITDVPLCIDSSVVEALRRGLAAYKGKPLLNSVTGEDERLETVLPVVAEFGCAVIGISNDETGISEDPDVRFEVAKKIVERVESYGIPRADVLIDPLAMPVGALRYAADSLFKIVRRVREELGCNAICGASNVSFGLPGRPRLNSTFLAMAIASGMTCAITNPIEHEIRETILAADVMLGHDENCAAWLQSQRSAAAGAASRTVDSDRAARRAQRRARRRSEA